MARRHRREDTKTREAAERPDEGGDVPSITHCEVPVKQTGGYCVREAVEGEGGEGCVSRVRRAAPEPQTIPVQRRTRPFEAAFVTCRMPKQWCATSDLWCFR